MTGLRMTKGLSDSSFFAAYQKHLWEAFPGVIPPLVSQNLLYWKNGYLALTRKGMDVQNQILLDFLP
ncbi:MAG: hypothetical protein GX786_10350 [Clostridiales bacterium]|nr:hypothetical protein [Clostridiales bacterium]